VVVGNGGDTCGGAQPVDLRYWWPTRRPTNCGAGGRPGGRPIVVLVANPEAGQERMLSGKNCHKRGGMESEDVFRGERCRKSEMERENVLRGESCNKSEIGRDNILRGGTGCWR